MSTTSRRALLGAAVAAGALTGAAAGTAIASLALPSQVWPDPVFETIQRYREAIVALRDALPAMFDIEDKIPSANRQWSWSCNELPEPPEGCTDDPRWIAVERATARAWIERGESTRALLTARPTTMRGLFALLELLSEPDFTGENGKGIFAASLDTNQEGVAVAASGFILHLRDVLQAMEART